MSVHAEIPGVKKEDIQISIDGNQVSISAEVKREKEEKQGEKLLRVERYYGKVYRAFSLAQDVDQENAKAKYENGVLELTLPKKAASATRRLDSAVSGCAKEKATSGSPFHCPGPEVESSEHGIDCPGSP